MSANKKKQKHHTGSKAAPWSHARTHTLPRTYTHTR